ncbi:MAG TPA: hypothetical protein VMV69_27325 [Pirellulales bacterium]|nr:hypothetical protein [Pirellulales bacterium]
MPEEKRVEWSVVWATCPICGDEVGFPPTFAAQVACCPRCAGLVQLKLENRVFWRPASDLATSTALSQHDVERRGLATSATALIVAASMLLTGVGAGFGLALALNSRHGTPAAATAPPPAVTASRAAPPSDEQAPPLERQASDARPAAPLDGAGDSFAPVADVTSMDDERGKLVFVVDASAEMRREAAGRSPWSRAQADLKLAFALLDQGHVFEAEFYRGGPSAGKSAKPAFCNGGRLTPFDGDSARRVARWGAEFGPKAPIVDDLTAIVAGLELRPHSLLLLTCSRRRGFTAREFAKVRAANPARTAIYVVEIRVPKGPYIADESLAVVARQSGGRHVYVDRP